MESLIKLLDVVAWPCVVLFVALKLRKPIEALLPLVENIKYKDFEVRSRQELEQVKEEAEEAGINAQIEIGDKAEIYKQIETSPSVAILDAWNELEFSARRKVETLAARDTKFKNPDQRPITFLEWTGALTPSASRTVRGLQSLRNQAAHYSARSKLTKEDALGFVSLSKGVQQQVEAISELPKIKLSALTLLVLQINRLIVSSSHRLIVSSSHRLIDSEKYSNITIQDAYNAIEQRRIIPYLEEAAKGDADFSLWREGGAYFEFVGYYHDQMYRMYDVYRGDEGRWGIQNRGLCLLLAWTNEIIQQGAGWHPNE